MTAETASWLYAVIPASGSGVPTDVRGVVGETLRLVRSESVAAIVGSVPAAEFDEKGLRERLEDLRWLESSARAHHRVVEAVADSGRALPLRFATVYRDDERVRDMLRQRSAEFTAALDRLVDRREWGVKAYADPDALAAASEQDPPEQGKSGTAYLLRKRARQRQREDAGERALDFARQIHATLIPLAADTVQHPPQDPELTGHDGWMVLNASYLVDDSRIEDFAGAVNAIEERFPGMRLELNGPWPAYSFVGTLSEN